MLKNIISILLICVISLSSVFAADIISVPIEKMNEQELNDFFFQYGFEAIAQNLCKGAVLYFLPGDVYIAGKLSEQSPANYCVSVPAKTLGTCEIVPTPIAILYAEAMKDSLSVATLKGLTTNDSVLMVVMFTPEEGMVLEPNSYNLARLELEKKAITYGFRIPEFYKTLEAMGIDKEKAIMTIEKNLASSEDIIYDVLLYKTQSSNQVAPSENLTKKDILFITLLSNLGLVVIIMLIYILSNKKRESKDTKTEDNTQIKSMNSTPKTEEAPIEEPETKE